MASNIVKFREYMKLIGQLKQVERTGWVRNGVKDPESVAEHMYRMAMMSFALPSDSGLDKDKCIKIALVHDMAESVVGDLTPWCGVSKEEKSRREEEATSRITSLIPGEGGKEMYNLWLEYEHQKSPEAKFVKDMDKLEMLFQAYEYEEMHKKPGHLQEFFDHTRETFKFTTEFAENWCKELVSQRSQSLEDSKDKSTTESDSVVPEAKKRKKEELEAENV
ncbi:5'-deoxynucleotidase HDDC2 [Aplysia californica]|uniref:5'-deoxynucleotidase HDDC2 n=1 Tax=Aplysia californica TaxID=6500 RepID=A0ABM0JWP9_APLCA|nr:5'-deoxynucleotidase HDDC2 [Aplysia californica]